ncbi:hypothetical protein JOM56_005012 [Amanita muscaria]
MACFESIVKDAGKGKSRGVPTSLLHQAFTIFYKRLLPLRDGVRTDYTEGSRKQRFVIVTGLIDPSEFTSCARAINKSRKAEWAAVSRPMPMKACSGGCLKKQFRNEIIHNIESFSNRAVIRNLKSLGRTFRYFLSEIATWARVEKVVLTDFVFGLDRDGVMFNDLMENIEWFFNLHDKDKDGHSEGRGVDPL